MKNAILFLCSLPLLLWQTGCTQQWDEHGGEVPENLMAGEESFLIQSNAQKGDQFLWEKHIRDEISYPNDTAGRGKVTITNEKWGKTELVQEEGGELRKAVSWSRIRYEKQGDSIKTRLLDTENGAVWGDYEDAAMRMNLNRPYFISLDEWGSPQKSSGLQYLLWREFPDTNYSADDHFLESAELEAVFPNKSVKTGDRWTNAFSRKAKYPMMQEATYQLRYVEEGIAYITVEATIRPHARPFAMQEAGKSVIYSLNGHKWGEYALNLKKGYIQEAQFEWEASGTRTEVNSEGKSTTFPIKVHRYVGYANHLEEPVKEMVPADIQPPVADNPDSNGEEQAVEEVPEKEEKPFLLLPRFGNLGK